MLQMSALRAINGIVARLALYEAHRKYEGRAMYYQCVAARNWHAIMKMHKSKLRIWWRRRAAGSIVSRREWKR